MKKRKYKLIVFLCLLALITTLFALLNGYRFTPQQAIKASSLIQGDFRIIDEVDRNWIKVYVIETQNGIKTATAEKRGFMWFCHITTYIYDDIIKNDPVKTVGWACYSKETDKQITVFAVQTDDPNVSYIEAGPNSDRQRINMPINETVLFIWDKIVHNKDLNAIAYDENDRPIYKYEYNPDHLNVTDAKELKWYPCSDNG